MKTVYIFKDKFMASLTGEMHYTDAKVMLCGISLDSFDKEKILFDYDSFEEIFKKHVTHLPQIEEYKEHLWKFGHCLYFDKQEKEQLPTFQSAIDLLEKYLFLSSNNNLKIGVIDQLLIDERVSFDSQRYIDALTSELINEIEKNEINAFGYININGRDEIIDDREQLDSYDKVMLKPFSLEETELVKKKIEQLKYWKKKTGEDKRTKPVNEALHMGISALLSLLRIDKFFEQKHIINSIDEIKVSNRMCKFVADFLILFQLYDYSEADINPNIFSNIRSLYSKPPKISVPLLYNVITEVKFFLNGLVNKMRSIEYPINK